jgi:hypothetical protein
VSAGSNQRVWWQCRVDPTHRWEATVNNRVGQQSGCPACSGRVPSATNNLAVARPDLATEWHPANPIPASAVTPQSHEVVRWRCARGHEWEARVQSRVQGRGCPVCAGKRVHPSTSFATRHPALVAEWDRDRNGGLGPEGVTAGSSRWVHWRCPAGHHYRARVCDRTRGRGCPRCGRRRALTHLIAARRRQAVRQRAARRRAGR